MASKKKLYQCHPGRQLAEIETFRTRQKTRREPADPASLERGVRQLLADKISGNLVGLWLLVPEHLRLGTWDLLTQWSQSPAPAAPHLALQLVHEAAWCVTGLRQSRTLSQKGFEVLNGLPFVASDQAIHDLLEAQAVAEAESLQVNLGWLRRARGHFQGSLLAIDPHRLHSQSKRLMPRFRQDLQSRPYQVAQGFFCLDAETHQPLCFSLSSSSVSVSQATPPLLRLASSILNPQDARPLVLADTEHYTEALFHPTFHQSPFDLIVPMPNSQAVRKSLQPIPPTDFQPRWAGWATTHRPFHFKEDPTTPYCQRVERSGEVLDQCSYPAFLATRYRDEVEDLALHFPQRWPIEEFFNLYPSMGWQRAGTLNLNVRYGQMSLALLAQTACHQLRQRWGDPYSSWDAGHLASSLFRGIDGDIRISHDTIRVTLYNVPQAQQLKKHYEDLPQILIQENINPCIPWLFGYKLDFRFK